MFVTASWFCLRSRVKDIFEDGETCTVTLKDRFKPQEKREKLWYARAFGNLTNMMKIDLSFKFSTQTVAAGKYLFFAQVDYTMFPELIEEFEGRKFPVNELQVMETNLEDEGYVGYTLEMEVPYGHYETKIFFKALDGQNADEGTE